MAKDQPIIDDHLDDDDLASLVNSLETRTSLPPPAATQPAVDEAKPAPSIHQQVRRRRYRLIGLAAVLTVVFVGILLWTSGIFRSETDVGQTVEIAPAVLFEQLCAEVRKHRLNTLHVAGFAVTDEMIPQISDLDWIDTFIADEGVLTDKSMVTLAKLPKLQHLRLRLSPINDAGMEELAKCESLWYLNLPHAECTAKGVAALAKLPRLRQLRLASPNLSNDVSREIASIQTLRSIHLIGVSITDEGLKTMGALPHLESLYLDDSAVTDAGWEWLFQEHPHLHVHIDEAHHDRDPKFHVHH
jgi:Leucine Rich repeat